LRKSLVYTILNSSFFILNFFHRSAQKGTSAGFPGDGSQLLTAALCTLQPAYSLRHSHL
jgi:hypothetical protein